MFTRVIARKSAFATATSTATRLSSSLVKPVASMSSFQTAIKSPTLSVVDFYADWCGPCKAMAPLLEKFASEYSSDTQFIKVNVDEQTDIAQEYGVTAMPTFMLFKNGEGLGKVIGANPNGLKKAIEELK